MQLHGLRGWGPLNGRLGLRVAVWPQGQSLMFAGFSLRPIGCTPALSVVGGGAQWLGRRSFAGGLSLICAWSMVDTCPLRG